MNKYLLIICFFILANCVNAQQKSEISSIINSSDYEVFVLRNEAGSKVEIANYGARIAAWYVKDNQGNRRNIVLGFGSKEKYEKADAPYYGAIVGRYANRIQNFEIDGQKVNLTDQEYLLHGGADGFHAKMWTLKSKSDSSVVLSYFSKDGEAGFPGNLNVQVEYVLTNQNELQLHYEATTDQITVVNLTNHAFFNLNGAGNGHVENMQLQVNAAQFTPLLDGGLPTGEILKVENTVFDLRKPKRIGDIIDSHDPQILLAKGLDHNFVNSSTDVPLLIATSPSSGIRMEMTTTLPGVQIYTANFLSGRDISDSGKAFKPQESICFEAQFFPNAPHHSNFPNVFLAPNQIYKHSTAYKVSVVNIDE